ncbi:MULTISPECIES: methyltransferase family protein [Olsenella]|uniref:methyltransferase family protein n=1 Tax=Olsenella TaxID=133925 RepID=UPI000231ED22|nr:MULTISPECIES: isoprenylcysteine carboxylmethyltransferase family protein [Olsenella]EHF02064.1 hypothetical protein HMPREF1008_00994 [Olsenella sp. oral taxon 809 str. F0356]
MGERDHLPLFGVGPAYVACILLTTAAGIAATRLGMLPRASVLELELPLVVAGAILAALAVAVWVMGAVVSKIDAHVERNELVTTGVYAWVRNPIYSAFLIACLGAILVAGNLWLLVLTPIHWLALTLLMRRTEERWLAELHGSTYLDYCRRVNRVVPWPPRRRA